jgi:hypothetical protein
MKSGGEPLFLFFVSLLLTTFFYDKMLIGKLWPETDTA